MKRLASALSFRELTAPGAGAIRILELRGPGALDALRQLSSRDHWKVGDLRLALLRARDSAEEAQKRSTSPAPPEGSGEVPLEVIDEALCHVVSDSCVELHVHGSEPVVRGLRELCQNQMGAEWNPPQEEASIEARALALVGAAPSEFGARLLLAQADGALRAELERGIEASPADLRSGLEALVEAGRVARFALRATPVVLSGPVNAGKSTLFNLLVRRADRALTSPVPGTTRDALSEPALFGAWPVQLFDTAGVRDLAGEAPDEQIEREGQALAERLRDRAELVLELHPADGEDPPPVSGPKIRQLRSLADRTSRPAGGNALSVHADPEAAAALCHRLFREAFRLPPAGASLAAAPFDDLSRSVVERALAELGEATEDLPSKIESARTLLASLL